MELFLIVGLAVYGGLAYFIGKLGSERGVPFQRGFWWSFLASPIIGLLVIIASKPNAAGGSASGSAATAWRQIRESLKANDYIDFAEAFRGSPEALEALKRRRAIDEWDALNKADGTAVEAFFNSEIFPALKQTVRQFITEEAGQSTFFGELNQRVLAQEIDAEREASERARRARARAREEEERKFRLKRLEQIGWGIAVLVVLAILFLRPF